MIERVNPEPHSKEEILRRAEEYGIDLSLLREQLKMSPTQRVESHRQFLRSVESFILEVKRARHRTHSQGSVRK
jgi:hypothetical protein